VNDLRTVILPGSPARGPRYAEGEVNDLRTVILEDSGSGVRTLTLNRPPVNALGKDLVSALEAAYLAIAEDTEARCLILRTAGKHFCAGADLKERRRMSVDEVRAFVPRLARLNDTLAAVPVPTIAAIRGVAAGGGCEMALACDIRILAEDARVGLRETALAILPGAGGTQRLPRIIGRANAKRWIFTARLYDARQALADGFADRVVPPERLDDEAAGLASEISANGPVAVRLAKRAVDGGMELGLTEAIDLERECYRGVLETEDRIEALDAFLEKRTPVFKGK
jgi:methylglutaconyl-CoA hydratase